MIYVKFDADNKSIEMRTEVDSVEQINYTHVEDNTLFGKRLLKLDNGVREFTQEEYDAEAAAIDRKQKAMVIDNMAREMLKQSNELIGPDLYEDLSTNKKAAVKKYRAALRGINRQETYPEFVEFPDEPII